MYKIFFFFFNKYYYATSIVYIAHSLTHTHRFPRSMAMECVERWAERCGVRARYCEDLVCSLARPIGVYRFARFNALSVCYFNVVSLYLNKVIPWVHTYLQTYNI